MKKIFKGNFIVMLMFFLSSILYAENISGLKKISENVYSYENVDSNTTKSFGANAGIIIGQDSIIVVDTLISAKESKRFIYV